MFALIVPAPGIAEIVLFAVILGTIFLVVRAVRQRGKFVVNAADAELPDVRTEHRVTLTVRRVYRDPNQGVWLVEGALGRRKLVFCATDYATNVEKYTALVGKEADIGLYGLATLAQGGAEAMRDQIKDIDKVDLSADPVRLVAAGQYANDQVVIGRILSHRDDTASGISVTVYRTQVVRTADQTLVLELAAERTPNNPFSDQSMVHGSARLYGYLPEA